MPSLRVVLRIDATNGLEGECEELSTEELVTAIVETLNCDSFLASMDCVEHGSLTAEVESVHNLKYLPPDARRSLLSER